MQLNVSEKAEIGRNIFIFTKLESLVLYMIFNLFHFFFYGYHSVCSIVFLVVLQYNHLS